MSGFENADSEAKKISLFSPTKGTCFFLNATNKYYGLSSHLEFCIKNAEWEKNNNKLRLKDSTFLQAINLHGRRVYKQLNFHFQL